VGEHDHANKAVKFIQRIQQIHGAVQDKLEKSQLKCKMCHDKHQFNHHF